MNDNMPKKSNACKRLLDIVSRIKAADPELSTTNAWIFVFDLPKDLSILEVVPYIKSFKQLILECKELVELYADEDNKIKYTDSLKILLKTTQQMDYNIKFKSIYNRIDHMLIKDLEYCATELKQYENEVVLPQDELNNLLDEILALKKSILDLNIEANLKKHCLTLLHALEQAILEYKIIGIEGFQEVLMTQSLRLKLILDELQSTEQNKFLGIFKKVWHYITIAEKAHGASMFAFTVGKQSSELYDKIKGIRP